MTKNENDILRNVSMGIKLSHFVINNKKNNPYDDSYRPLFIHKLIDSNSLKFKCNIELLMLAN